MSGLLDKVKNILSTRLYIQSNDTTLKKGRDCSTVPARNSDRYYMSIFSGNFMSKNYDITCMQAINYYTSVAPLSTAVDLIADEIASVQPILYDIINDKIDNEGDILTLLEHPGVDCTREDFFKQMAAYYELTGNCYLIATGIVNRPPLELSVIQPQRVYAYPDERDGYVAYYTVNNTTGTETFKRQIVDGKFRYYSGEGRELWHIKDFNPRYSNTMLVGISKLNAIYYEIEQYLNSNVHNLSTLMKGARPSGALVLDRALSADQRDTVKRSFANRFQGADNAGDVVVLEAGGGQFVPMSLTNVEMDYAQNKKDIAVAIYNRLKIPLPLVSPDHMALSNYSEAKINLYDNAVLPLCNVFYGELTNFLMPRYKNKTQVLTWDDATIPALEPRRNAEINKKQQSGVLTINEVRTLLGYEEIEGGDQLYQQMSLVPIGADRFTGDNRTKPATQKPTKEEVIAAMTKQIDAHGKRRFTDGYIAEVVNACN